MCGAPEARTERKEASSEPRGSPARCGAEGTGRNHLSLVAMQIELSIILYKHLAATTCRGFTMPPRAALTSRHIFTRLPGLLSACG
jgi:hypothetical protein